MPNRVASDKTPEETSLPVIVGIGSSAGGLEAIRELVSNLPRDNGCAYVIVQHMSPQHKSLMTTLIASETTVDVMDLQDGMVPLADKIYVTPPRKDVIVKEGKLCLVEPSLDASKPKPSVDRFLKSAADECGERCMAIILSGTGSDGAYGVEAVREAGGITIAQDDASAKYDGMSNAAVETGCVDLVLRPSMIGTHLKKILSSPGSVEQVRDDATLTSPIMGILQIVLAHTRVDFRDYKQSTILRRIDRRMTALGIETSEDYAAHCRNNPHEVDALFKDLLISVTRFFRDKEEFDDLVEPIKELVEAERDEPLRIWVAGCATGEEVYSIAILLAEAMGGPAELLKSNAQIFATDIDRAALDSARSGQYSPSAMFDVPPEYADKYFIQHSDRMHVIEALRSVVLFSDHNLCQDPPYLNIDLICCRNVLIYFGLKLQNKVLSRLHYAMKPSSYLFLGTAESVASTDQLFSLANDKSRIFKKRELRKNATYAPKTLSGSWTARPPLERRTDKPKEPSTDRRMFDALARSLGENSVLVSSDYSFQRVYGDISDYIDLSEQTDLNLKLSLLKSPFRQEARSLVTLALKHNERRVGVRHSTGENDERVVRLEALPINSLDSDDRLALLVINSWEADQFDELSNTGAVLPGEVLTGDHLHELDLELAKTREALQQTIEEQESSNEELQSLSEEMQATNEELQATNEELGTSNEELQSTNEELITVNEELQVNSSELQALNAELGSVLGNVPLPLLVLDTALQIVRASNAAIDLFSINQSLRTPHLSQINLPDGFPKLMDICNRSLETGTPENADFVSRGAAYSLQCAPFSNIAGQLIGTTIVFLTTPALQTLSTELSKILELAPVHLINLSETGDIRRISHQSANLLGVSPEAQETETIQNLVAERPEDVQNALASLTAAKPKSDTVVKINDAVSGEPRWISATRHEYIDPSQGHGKSALVVGTDVTQSVEHERQSRIQAGSLDLVQRFSGIGYWRIDLPSEKLHWSEQVYDLHGYKKGRFVPDIESAVAAFHPEDRAAVRDKFEAAVQKQQGFELRARILNRDGQEVQVETIAEPLCGEDGSPIAICGAIRECAV